MNRTIQREAILKELKHNKKHPTADEIYIKLRISMPQLSLATVYRNLEQMADLGLIRKISIAGRQARFDGETECHFHLRCTKCGFVRNIGIEELFDIDCMLKKIVKKHEFTGYEFEFQHICEICRRELIELEKKFEETPKKILSMLDP